MTAVAMVDELKCPECPATFTAPHALAAHRRYLHGVLGRRARAKIAAGAARTCELCDAPIADDLAAREHARRHLPVFTIPFERRPDRRPAPRRRRRRELVTAAELEVGDEILAGDAGAFVVVALVVDGDAVEISGATRRFTVRPSTRFVRRRSS